MNTEDIIEALESTAYAPSGGIIERANASRRDILNYKKSLLRFLEELEAEITVGEIRAVLGEYE